MNISPVLIHFICAHEGCKLEAYLCPAKIPTIGYGNTSYEDGTKVKLGDKITQDRANGLVFLIAKSFADYVNKVVKVPLKQNQFDALVDLCYNIGPASFANSTVLKLVNANPNDKKIADAFKMWNKGDGKILPGLVARRQDEVNLYLS